VTIGVLRRCDEGVDGEQTTSKESRLDVGIDQFHSTASAAADHNRNVRDTDFKPIEHVLRVAIAIEINVKGMPVPGQELLRPKSLRAVRRADHDRVAQIVGNQFDPAQDERAWSSTASRSPASMDFWAGVAHPLVSGWPGPDRSCRGR